MLSFEKSGKYCFFNDEKAKICYPSNCDDIYPKKKGWTMYGLSWCPYREKASNLLMQKKIPFFYYDIEKEPFNGKEKFKKMMADYLKGQQTTPAIFYNGKLIGGYSNLTTLF
jgi:glutaredoxin